MLISPIYLLSLTSKMHIMAKKIVIDEILEIKKVSGSNYLRVPAKVIRKHNIDVNGKFKMDLHCLDDDEIPVNHPFRNA